MPPYLHPTAVKYVPAAVKNAGRLPGCGVSLRAVKQVELTYDPWLGRANFETITFFNRLTGRRLTNPNAVLKSTILNNRTSPSVQVTFLDGHVWVMDKTDIAHKYMAHEFYAVSDHREPEVEKVDDDDDKKKKKKKKI